MYYCTSKSSFTTASNVSNALEDSSATRTLGNYADPQKLHNGLRYKNYEKSVKRQHSAAFKYIQSSGSI
jgi:hypothetical protein